MRYRKSMLFKVGSFCMGLLLLAIPAGQVNAQTSEAEAAAPAAQATSSLPTSISLNAEKLLTCVGAELILEAQVDSDLFDVNLSWESSDPAVAEVLGQFINQGSVTCKGIGRTIISATTQNGLTAYCILYVGKEKPAESISLTESSFSMFPGEYRLLNAVVTPGESYQHTTTWESSNPAVARVE